MKLVWQKATPDYTGRSWLCNGKHDGVDIGTQNVNSPDLPDWFWKWYMHVNPEFHAP